MTFYRFTSSRFPPNARKRCDTQTQAATFFVEFRERRFGKILVRLPGRKGRERNVIDLINVTVNVNVDDNNINKITYQYVSQPLNMKINDEILFLIRLFTLCFALSLNLDYKVRIIFEFLPILSPRVKQNYLFKSHLEFN